MFLTWKQHRNHDVASFYTVGYTVGYTVPPTVGGIGSDSEIRPMPPTVGGAERERGNMREKDLLCDDLCEVVAVGSIFCSIRRGRQAEAGPWSTSPATVTRLRPERSSIGAVDGSPNHPGARSRGVGERTVRGELSVDERIRVDSDGREAGAKIASPRSTNRESGARVAESPFDEACGRFGGKMGQIRPLFPVLDRKTPYPIGKSPIRRWAPDGIHYKKGAISRKEIILLKYTIGPQKEDDSPIFLSRSARRSQVPGRVTIADLQPAWPRHLPLPKRIEQPNRMMSRRMKRNPMNVFDVWLPP